MGGASGVNRRYSLSGSMLQRQNHKFERTALHSHPSNKLAQLHGGGKKSNAAKKQAKITNSRDFGSPKNRKPFTVIHGAVFAVANPENTPEKQIITPPKTLSAGNTARNPPMKPNSGDKGGSNLNPKKLLSPVKVSPSPLSIGPATPYTPASVKVVEVENDDNFEYCFEEIRAGFDLPQLILKKACNFKLLR